MNEEVVINMIQKILNNKILVKSGDFISNLGMSSMQMVRLAVSLEELCGKEIDPQIMASAETVSDLVEIIK